MGFSAGKKRFNSWIETVVTSGTLELLFPLSTFLVGQDCGGWAGGHCGHPALLSAVWLWADGYPLC